MCKPWAVTMETQNRQTMNSAITSMNNNVMSVLNRLCCFKGAATHTISSNILLLNTTRDPATDLKWMSTYALNLEMMHPTKPPVQLLLIINDIASGSSQFLPIDFMTTSQVSVILHLRIWSQTSSHLLAWIYASWNQYVCWEPSVTEQNNPCIKSMT